MLLTNLRVETALEWSKADVCWTKTFAHPLISNVKTRYTLSSAVNIMRLKMPYSSIRRFTNTSMILLSVAAYSGHPTTNK